MTDGGSFGPSRRAVLAMAGAMLAAGSSVARALPSPATHHLGLPAGDFEWLLGRAPDGPVFIVASIPRQLVHVYRAGILVGVSSCSTGKPGNSTPAGRFRVLNKYKDHRSSKYGDPMPNTLRLTWKGVALHGGELPGYPASHGCVRLPLDFADQLFELTAIGTPVVIGGHAQHYLVDGAGVVPAGPAGNIVAAREAARSLVPAGRNADTAILVSAADKRIYALQDNTILAQGPVSIDDAGVPIGTNVFVWRGGDQDKAASVWTRAGFEPVSGAATVTDAAVLERIRGNSKLMASIEPLMHSGTVLLTTDQPLNAARAVRHRPRRTVHRKRKRSAQRRRR